MTRPPMPEPGSAADVVRAWDVRADRYLGLFRHELEGKPFDRGALAAFAARMPRGGRVVDGVVNGPSDLRVGEVKRLVWCGAGEDVAANRPGMVAGRDTKGAGGHLA